MHTNTAHVSTSSKFSKSTELIFPTVQRKPTLLKNAVFNHLEQTFQNFPVLKVFF